MIRPRCARCQKTPAEIPEYLELARDNDEALPQYAIEWHEFMIEEEGTYNPETGAFLCTICYVAAGCPSAPGGWKA